MSDLTVKGKCFACGRSKLYFLDDGFSSPLEEDLSFLLIVVGETHIFLISSLLNTSDMLSSLSLFNGTLLPVLKPLKTELVHELYPTTLFPSAFEQRMFSMCDNRNDNYTTETVCPKNKGGKS